MAEFDLVVAGGEVITASDCVHCDVGVEDGRLGGAPLDGPHPARGMASAMWPTP